MKTLGLKLQGIFARFPLSGLRLLYLEGLLLFALLASFWILGNRWMLQNYPLGGALDPSIWLLILLSIICFLSITLLCWFMLQRIWLALGLPDTAILLSQFKTLALWQQLAFYCFFFALLLATATGCLIAIC